MVRDASLRDAPHHEAEIGYIVGVFLGAPLLRNSRDIKRRLEQEGWILERVTGSHHVFKHPTVKTTVILPHPKKDLGKGLVRNIYKTAHWDFD